MDITLIAIGHRARHGKDYLAQVFNEKFKGGAFVTHWADPLKEEISNKEREHPLIYSKKDINGKTWYGLLNKKSINVDDVIYYYDLLPEERVPYLHKIFLERKINEYWGMDEKDSVMLQFWGTDYRRMMYDPNYWVTKTFNIIKKEILRNSELKYVLIPDTRFINEVDSVKTLNGHYIKVVRLNEDGSEFRDSSRDPDHPSEKELENYEADLTFYAKSGELKKFEAFAERLGMLKPSINLFDRI